MPASISLSTRAVRPAAALAVVAVAATVVTIVALRPEQRAQPSVSSLSFPYVPTAPSPARAPAPVPAVEPAGGTAAVEAALRARVQRDDAVAWALLDGESLRRFPLPEAWAIAQAEILPPRSFTVLSSAAAGDHVDVTVRVTRTPVVNDSLGFVAASATEVWRAVRQDGRWRVAAEPRSSIADLPADSLAPAAVAAWLDAQGPARGALQNDSFLYGPRDLVAAVARAAGPWQPAGAAAAPASTPADIAALIAAYGPAIDTFVRLVPIAGQSARAWVAVVPVGNRWLVAGVLPAGNDAFGIDGYEPSRR